MQKSIKAFLLIFTVVSFNSILSQELSQSWKLIKSDNISDIYIEPINIIEYGNEISVWSFEKLKEPKLSEKDEKIFSIKTHYLFNKIKKRYAVIGTLYYDAKGGIIDRSSKSNFNTGPAVFMTPISYNPNTEIIYNEANSYLIVGNINVVDSNSDIETNTIVLSPSAINSTDSNITEQNFKIDNSSKDNVNETPKIDAKLEMSERPTIEIVASSKIQETDDSINITIDKVEEYNFSNEKALKNAIFTDGNLYCFQVSSWKTKAYADRELNKLISKGYNAFLVSVKPKNKSSIWHRVRVGYFDSLQKTKDMQRKIK